MRKPHDSRTEHNVSRASRLLLWASITTVAGFLIWANWAELDTYTARCKAP